MFRRLRLGNRRHEIPQELIERKLEAERLQVEAQIELQEARQISSRLREIRLNNHFAEGFRRSLGGNGG